MDIGDKYYKILEDYTVDIVRIHKYINDDILIISRGCSTKKVNKGYISSYTKLNPDGHVFFNIVNMGNTEESGKDVVVLLYRKKDLDNQINTPYATCRQNIHDFYSNATNNSNKTYIGISISKDTTPEDVTYEDVLVCNGIEYSEKISIYLDDTLNDILPMVNNIKSFNGVLYTLHKAMKDSLFIGTSKSLESLLRDNNFEYDIKRAFDIIPVDFVVKYRDYVLHNDQVTLLQNILKTEISQTYVLPYSKEISLSDIERDYILVSDKIGRLYIIAYDKGKYINDSYFNKDDIISMIKNMQQ